MEENAKAFNGQTCAAYLEELKRELSLRIVFVGPDEHGMIHGKVV